MTAEKLPVVAWLVEHGAVGLPIGDPSRLVTVEAFDTKEAADAATQASEYNAAFGPATWLGLAEYAMSAASARIAELERENEALRKDAGRWRELDQGDGACPLYPGGYLMLAVHYPPGGYPVHEVADYNTAIDAAISAKEGGK